MTSAPRDPTLWRWDTSRHAYVHMYEHIVMLVRTHHRIWGQESRTWTRLLQKSCKNHCNYWKGTFLCVNVTTRVNMTSVPCEPPTLSQWYVRCDAYVHIHGHVHIFMLIVVYCFLSSHLSICHTQCLIPDWFAGSWQYRTMRSWRCQVPCFAVHAKRGCCFRLLFPGIESGELCQETPMTLDLNC